MSFVTSELLSVCAEWSVEKRVLQAGICVGENPPDARTQESDNATAREETYLLPAKSYHSYTSKD